MKALSALLLSGSILFTAGIAAKEATSEKEAKKAAHLREALFELVYSNMGPLGAMAKGRIPLDAKVMAENGQRLEHLGMMIEHYLETDTRKYKVKTEALDAIWEDKEDFAQKIDDFISATQNLQTVAKSGDESQYRAAIGGVGKTCKGCHDKYKED